MHPVKERIDALLAQARGTRWDRFAARVCGWGAILIALSPYVHLLPGPEARIIAGILGFIGQYLPRAQMAAGLWTAAVGQQTPFLKILPQLMQTLITAPQITAEAKAQADATQKAQDAQATMAEVNAAIDALEKRLNEKSGAFTAGTGPGNLSQVVPESLQAEAGPVAEAGTVLAEKTTPVVQQEAVQ